LKILFDANTPAPLARFLRGHDAVQADELGWQGLENGVKMAPYSTRLKMRGFDLLLTFHASSNARLGPITR
jgi:hypothetical protein